MQARDASTESRQFPARLITIDYMKGLSMMVIFYAHFGWTWRADSWISLGRIQWFFMDFFGPAMFVTLSVVGSMLSLYKSNVGRDPALFSMKTLLKVSYVLAIGEIMNLVNAWQMGLYHLAGWNVVTFIGLFSYLLLPALLRLKPPVKVLIIVGTLLAYYPLLFWASGGLVDAGITPFGITLASTADPRVAIYQLLLHQVMMTPLLPWLVMPLLASLVFNGLARAYKDRSWERLKAESRKILKIGIACLLIGLVMGAFLWRGIDQSAYEEMMHGDAFQFWPFDAGVPMFWTRHTPQYILYSFGLICILFSALSSKEYSDVRFPAQDHVANFGELSFTAYMLSNLGYLVTIKMDFWPFLPIVCGIIVGFIELLWTWARRWRRVGTIEWLMVVYIGLVMRARGSKNAPAPVEHVNGEVSR